MSELIKKTTEPIAVGEDLTVLLNWVNIEQVSGFIVIVANAGGGSANDITDVQVDTSDDGGITVSTDQHPGVPAVPIATGKAAVGTFDETAKFVRLRGLCAAGEDTTADCYLLADSSVGRICTLADVRDRLGLGDTDNDSTINRIIVGIESVFNRFTSRYLVLNAVDVTGYFTACGPRFQLNRYPVVAITSIKESYDYDFDSADALTADTDYRLVRQGKNGILYRINTNWPQIEEGIQVVYRGGYCPAGQTPGESEFAMPADLREAAIEQTSFIFKRKDDIGLSGVGFEGGSISKFSAIDLLPIVKKILETYRKVS